MRAWRWRGDRGRCWRTVWICWASPPRRRCKWQHDAASRRRDATRNNGTARLGVADRGPAARHRGAAGRADVPEVGCGDGFFRPQAQSRRAAGAECSADDDDVIVPDDAAGTARRPSADDGQAEGDARTTSTPCCPARKWRCPTPNSPPANARKPRAPRRKRAAASSAAQAGAAAGTPRSAGARRPRPQPCRHAPPAAGRGRAQPADDAPLHPAGRRVRRSGDAEAVKAKIALLGLSARVESAQINGKTVYRVRMGPYGTAGELAEAKRKLGSGGLPAMAIKAK